MRLGKSVTAAFMMGTLFGIGATGQRPQVRTIRAAVAGGPRLIITEPIPGKKVMWRRSAFVNVFAPVTMTVNDNGDTHDANTADQTCADANGRCTLRAAVEQINAIGAGNIGFSLPLPNTIVLTLGELTTDAANGDITVAGPGAAFLTVKRDTSPGASEFRIFELSGAHVNRISGITIQDGVNRTPAVPYNSGGCVLVGPNADANLDLVTIRNCSSNYGGGIVSYSRLVISRSTFRENSATLGGAINVNTWDAVLPSTASISECTFYKNMAIQGGAINNNNDWTVVSVANSTFTSNRADTAFSPEFGQVLEGNGGGLVDIGRLELVNTTVAGNRCTDYGCGVASFAEAFYTNERAHFRNTIVSGNPGGLSSSTDVYAPPYDGDIMSEGNNLIGVGPVGGIMNGVNGDMIGSVTAPIDAMLGPLADNGGPTLTQALLPTSPALNAGNNCVLEQGTSGGCLADALLSDQRGVPYSRISGSSVDTGSFESQLTPAAASIGGRVMNPLGLGVRNVTVSLVDQNGEVSTVPTSAFGYFLFKEVPAGRSYLILPISRRYGYSAEAIFLTDSRRDLNFWPRP